MGKQAAAVGLGVLGALIAWEFVKKPIQSAAA